MSRAVLRRIALAALVAAFFVLWPCPTQATWADVFDKYPLELLNLNASSIQRLTNDLAAREFPLASGGRRGFDWQGGFTFIADPRASGGYGLFYYPNVHDNGLLNEFSSDEFFFLPRGQGHHSLRDLLGDKSRNLGLDPDDIVGTPFLPSQVRGGHLIVEMRDGKPVLTQIGLVSRFNGETRMPAADEQRQLIDAVRKTMANSNIDIADDVSLVLRGKEEKQLAAAIAKSGAMTEEQATLSAWLKVGVHDPEAHLLDLRQRLLARTAGARIVQGAREHGAAVRGAVVSLGANVIGNYLLGDAADLLPPIRDFVTSTSRYQLFLIAYATKIAAVRNLAINAARFAARAGLYAIIAGEVLYLGYLGLDYWDATATRERILQRYPDDPQSFAPTPYEQNPYGLPFQ